MSTYEAKLLARYTSLEEKIKQAATGGVYAFTEQKTVEYGTVYGGGIRYKPETPPVNPKVIPPVEPLPPPTLLSSLGLPETISLFGYTINTIYLLAAIPIILIVIALARS